MQSTTCEKVLVLEDARETKIMGLAERERKFDFGLDFNNCNQRLSHAFGSYCLPILEMVSCQVDGFIVVAVFNAPILFARVL